MTVSQTFLVLDDNDNPKYWSGIFRMFLKWNLSDIFLMMRLWLWVWGNKIIKVNGHFNYIILWVYSIDMIITTDSNLDQLAETVSGFSIVKFLFFLLFAIL